MKTWLFWDWWHIEHQDNVLIRQGRPQWVPEATYEDPTLDYLGFWPRVWCDETSGQWSMLYFASGLPLTLMGAESDDGVHWRPMNRPDIRPDGEKYAPNHLFTVPAANGGPLYLDSVADDGKKFKFYCVQRGGPAAERAKHASDKRFHEVLSGKGVKPYLSENLLATSEDGFHWKIDDDTAWNFPGWHPDPPMCCYYNRKDREHVMVTRPGWGDRRIATITSNDARSWRNLQMIMQPDVIDPPQTQFYGMPVHPYGEGYVGFLWMAHFSSAHRLERFNQLWGRIDSQLAYSWDGRHFQRQLRKPFIAVNGPGQPGSGVIYPTDLIEVDGTLRIYSGATKDLHHQSTHKQFIPKGQMPPTSVILHTLRKEGFTYLASQGNWATFTSKPVILRKPELRINVLAPHGELEFQLTDVQSRQIKGFSFDQCLPLKGCDELDAQILWRNASLNDVAHKVVRLEVRFRHARIYAFHGDFHFVDAMDMLLAEDGKPVPDEPFDN